MQLLGISKRGDTYLRKLLIHGARSVIFGVKGCDRSEYLAGSPATEAAQECRHGCDPSSPDARVALQAPSSSLELEG